MIRSLVVNHDEGVAREVGEVIESLGHQFDSARDVSSARELLARGGHDYVMLGLKIPLHIGRVSRVANGKNLLGNIVRGELGKRVPVIATACNGHDCSKLAATVMKIGAVDYVSEPFLAGDLDLAILQAISTCGKRLKALAPPLDEPTPVIPVEAPTSPRNSAKPRPFEKGELVVIPEAVELEKVKICGAAGNSRIRKIIDELCRHDSKGRFVALSGAQLADVVGAGLRGQNAVAEAIRDFRKNVTEEMKGEAGLEVGPQDIIQTTRRGYQLSEKIRVRDGAGKAEKDPPPELAGNETTLNERQEWILEQARKGEDVSRARLKDMFSVSDRTSKRDFSGLAKRGLVEFVRVPPPGHYEATPAS